jgi:hypothetical protein
LLFWLAAVLAVIGVYAFSASIGALIEWARSPEPWWRP